MTRPRLELVRLRGEPVRVRSYGSWYALAVIVIAALTYALLSWSVSR